MLNLSESHGPIQQIGQTEIHEFRLLIAIAVAWFFVIVVVSRLLPRTWRPSLSLAISGAITQNSNWWRMVRLRCFGGSGGGRGGVRGFVVEGRVSGCGGCGRW